MKSPCKDCPAYNMPDCAENCDRLNLFQDMLKNKHIYFSEDTFTNELPVHKDSIRSVSYR